MEALLVKIACVIMALLEAHNKMEHVNVIVLPWWIYVGLTASVIQVIVSYNIDQPGVNHAQQMSIWMSKITLDNVKRFFPIYQAATWAQTKRVFFAMTVTDTCQGQREIQPLLAHTYMEHVLFAMTRLMLFRVLAVTGSLALFVI